MASRLDLHEELCTILGSRNVYFQPPEKQLMRYPCIRYSLAGIDQKFADDKTYNRTNRYEITVLETQSDSVIHEAIMDHFEMCSFDRSYVADNLYHKVLILYY